jgi:hypothetical protein
MPLRCGPAPRPPPAVKPAPALPKVVPPQGQAPKSVDGFEGPSVGTRKDQILKSPQFGKLSQGAQELLRRALPFVTSDKQLGALESQLNSKWFQGLAPDEQAKTMKSFLREAVPAWNSYEKKRELVQNLRG